MNVSRDRLLYLAAAASVGLALVSAGLLGYSRLPPSEYRAGDRLDVPEVRFVDAGTTAVLWIDSRCGACTESLPFYRALSAGKGAGRLVVLGREAKEDLAFYLRTRGISADQIIAVDRRPLKFVATPTLVIANRRGEIQDMWTGQVRAPDVQQRIIAALR